MKKIISIALVLFVVVFLLWSWGSGQTFTEPADPNTAIGTYTFRIGEDVNEVIIGINTYYLDDSNQPNRTIITVAGLPAGLTLIQSLADTNLPSTVYTSMTDPNNDPQYMAYKTLGVPFNVGRAYIKGRPNKFVSNAVATITNTSSISGLTHIETMTINVSELTPGLRRYK